MYRGKRTLFYFSELFWIDSLTNIVKRYIVRLVTVKNHEPIFYRSIHSVQNANKCERRVTINPLYSEAKLSVPWEILTVFKRTSCRRMIYKTSFPTYTYTHIYIYTHYSRPLLHFTRKSQENTLSCHSVAYIYDRASSLCINERRRLVTSPGNWKIFRHSHTYYRPAKNLGCSVRLDI